MSWTLGDRFENLVLTGDSAIDGTGNAADNSLTGNDAANRLSGGPDNDQLDGGAGNDVLDGGSGSDLMDGGSGNDIYYVDGLSDLITEQPGAGQDTGVQRGFLRLARRGRDTSTDRQWHRRGWQCFGQRISSVMAARTRWRAVRVTIN